MNAADVTHCLKIIGGGTKMWVGVIVVAAACSAICLWLNKPENRRAILNGLYSR